MADFEVKQCRIREERSLDSQQISSFINMLVENKENIPPQTAVFKKSKQVFAPLFPRDWKVL
jgi:hypothetical protein